MITVLLESTAYLRSGFFNLGTPDILGWVICYGRPVLRIVGCFHDPWASTHQMPIALPSCDTKKFPQVLLTVPWAHLG